MLDYNNVKIHNRNHKRKTGGIKSERFPPTVETVTKPRLSNAELQHQLVEAGQAARELAEQKELERQASEFDTLAKEQARRIAITKANQLYNEIKGALITEADEIKEMVKDVNQAIAAVEPELKSLAEKFSAVQTRIFAHYGKSVKASKQHFFAIAPAFDPHTPFLAQPQPDSLGDWVAIIGDDKHLKTVSPYGRGRLVETLLQSVQPSIYLNSAQLKELSKYRGW